MSAPTEEHGRFWHYSAEASLNLDELRGRILISFPTSPTASRDLYAQVFGEQGGHADLSRDERDELSIKVERLRGEAAVEEASELAANLPEGVAIRGASMHVGRGASAMLPSLELWHTMSDEAGRVMVWLAAGGLLTHAVKRTYDFVRSRLRGKPLVSPEGLIHSWLPSRF